MKHFLRVISLSIILILTTLSGNVFSDFQNSILGEKEFILNSNDGGDANNSSIEEATTWTDLVFAGGMEVGSQYNGSFSTFIIQDISFPSTILNNQSLRLDEQIDSQFGDSDGNMSAIEWQIFSNFSAINSLTMIPGIALDSQQLNTNFVMKNLTFDGAFPHLVGEPGNYSWFGEGNFSGQRANLPLAQLSISDVPFGIVPRPVSIHLENPVEYRWSPNSVDVNGTPSDFTVYYQFSTTFYVVTFGDNTPLVSNLVSPSRSLSGIPFNGEQNFVVSTEDAGLDYDVNCVWNFSSMGKSIELTGLSVNLTPNEISGWEGGGLLAVSSTCLDYHGESHQLNGSWGLDDSAPVVNWLNATVGCGQAVNTMTEVNILNCDSLSIPAGMRIEIIGNVSDDFTEFPSARWSSNKTPNWWQEGKQISIIFYQGPQSNSFDDPLEERYLGRNSSIYSLNFSVSDDAGHEWNRSWEVHLLDNQPPSVRPSVIANGIPVSTSHVAHEGDEMSISLNESFDDISAIDETSWWFDLDSEPIQGMQNVSWNTARYFSIGSLDGGYHWLNITSQDEVGNTNSEPYPVFIMIQPKAELDLRITAIELDESSANSQNPNAIRLLVQIQNSGGQSGPFQLCVEKQCVNQTAIAATADGLGVSSHVLDLDLPYGADTTVMVAWFDANNELHFDYMASGVVVSREYSSAEQFAFAAVIVSVLVGLWWRSKSSSD